jgi:ATP-binding cassette subfamily A (ABC1) protein 1
MQSLLSKSKFSGLISSIVYFTAVLSNIPVESATASKTWKAILSLIPQVASLQISAVLAGFESANVGIHKDTINEWYDNYTYLEGLILLIVSGFLFTFLGLYLDKVLPKEYGDSEPWYFFCSPRFYPCCRQGRRPVN